MHGERPALTPDPDGPPATRGVTARPYRSWFHVESEDALPKSTNVPPSQLPHLVNGLSLEVARQADRIRRRSHSKDWPGAASAMSELEEAVDLLATFVHVNLQAAIEGDDEPEPDPAPAEPVPALSTGQYL